MPTPAEWERTFSAWAASPSQSEQEKCNNAVRAVQRAIDASAALAGRMVRVFAQGSYRNRTNVRADSDVDVCVCSSATLLFDPIVPPSQIGLGPATYLFPQFREDVRAALAAHFGLAAVTSGSKAFNVRENTNRIAADVVPTFEYREYVLGFALHVGTAFMCDGRRIVNFPEQHYNNGVAKNDATGRRFKATARVLKRLRYEMLNDGINSAAGVQSFGLESLVWNVPDAVFGVVSLLDALYAEIRIRERLKAVLRHLYAGTESDEACAAWTEVNGIKPLFGPVQPWTRAGARTFLAAAWDYAELNQ